MKRIRAIARLTLTAALRSRLIIVLAVLLVGSVGLLPLLIKDDGTARGFVQIILTYTLSVTTFLLGLATLWLSCGTLAQEVEDCQIQMVVVKPVARWQIWLGKWLGICLMNILLLTIVGGAVYGLMRWRARQLPAEQQEVLRNEVLVARGSVREPQPDLEPAVEQELQRRLQTSPVPAAEVEMLRAQLREQAKAELQILRPSYRRTWVLDLGLARNWLRDVPLYLRVKFATTDQRSTVDEPRTYRTLWQAGVPDTARVWRDEKYLASDTFHEFSIPPNLFDDTGRIVVECINPNDVTMLFMIEDGLELLYREGSFGLNFVRGLGIIFCWLALIAALGLAAASCLSFPVAAFVSLAALIIAFSSGTMSQIIEERGIAGINPKTGKVDQPDVIDQVAVAFFSGVLKLVNLVREFSPIDALSSGRSITWGQLAQAIGQIVFFVGGGLGGIGIWLFYRRELAAAQGGV